MLPGWLGFFDSLAPKESRTGWQIGRKTTGSFYEWFEDPAHAKDAQIIHSFFTAQFKSIPSWLDGIDFANTYAKDVTASDVVFVDVGGGNGQECEKLRAKTPSLVGKVIHQDLAGPLERAPKIDGVEKMVYDYFGPQKVTGAYSSAALLSQSQADASNLVKEHGYTTSDRFSTTTLIRTASTYFETMVQL